MIPLFLRASLLIGMLAICLATIASAAEVRLGVSQNLVLAPAPGNPRNSEGDFICLKGDNVLFVYTHFTGGADDDAAAYLSSRVSTDDGKTWSDHDEIVAKAPGKGNFMSVSLLRLADGRIALFYLDKKSPLDWRVMMRLSADEAKSWDEPALCMPDAGIFVVNNGRVVQLKNGRIIIPSAEHDLPKDKPGFHNRGVAVCFYSDDNGVTWHRSKGMLEAPLASRSGLQEPSVVELKDGKLMMLCRTDQGSQFRCESDDGGDTWSPAVASDIISPLSPASIKRIPKTGNLLMVWNDHQNVDASLRYKRTPLTAAVSSDEGKTWQHRKTLYDDPQGWYCYTAISFAGDRVLLGHCAGKQAKGSSGLATTVVSSFDLDWLYRP